ncbi:MAG: lysophospholipid acyltransferase family protein [Verrucomicrobiota bacterium]
MQVVGTSLYRLVRWVLQTALGFYFARIERFHPERVPRDGPVLFVSNHPNSVSDAFVIGTSVPRKVNFVATVRLFRLKPVRWLLTQCGVIPINRVKDDPRAMRTVLDSFEACFRVLERGEAIGIFPEGITHDDPQLKAVKTGAARMALELEHRHGGRLGLHIVPVGLTFSAKEIYRSEVLVNFGEPIRAANFLPGYPEKKRDCIHALNGEIEQCIQSLILHLSKLERARIVEAVKRLYFDRLLAGNTVIHEPVTAKAEELLLTQAIANAVDFTFDNHPERAAAFVRKLDHYERRLQRLQLSDEVLAHFPARQPLVWRSMAWALLAVMVAPLAAYGWVHRLAPFALIRWAVRRHARAPGDKTHVSTVSVLAGVAGFGCFYGLFIAIFHQFFGWPATFWYALSLPVASLVAHYYVRGLRRFAAGCQAALVLMRAPLAARQLLDLRSQLIAEIEAERQEFNRAAGRYERKEGP